MEKKTFLQSEIWQFDSFWQKILFRVVWLKIRLFTPEIDMYLVLALESISKIKSWFFDKKKNPPKKKTPPWIQFSVKNCQIIIFHCGEKFFFLFNQFFFIHIKVAYCCEGSPKNNENPVAYYKHSIWRFSKKN
jgi:hypothetical protein